jgi:hypothetical protein
MSFTSSRVYFCIKNTFSNSFNHFNTSLDWASINGKRRGLGAVLPKTQIAAARTAGSISKRSRVSYAKWPGRRGI